MLSTRTLQQLYELQRQARQRADGRQIEHVLERDSRRECAQYDVLIREVGRLQRIENGATDAALDQGTDGHGVLSFVEDGAPQAFFTNPQSERARDFLRQLLPGS